MKVEIIFTKDYANKKKDETVKIDSLIASNLIRLKVAKIKGKAPKKVSTKTAQDKK